MSALLDLLDRLRGTAWRRLGLGVASFCMGSKLAAWELQQSCMGLAKLAETRASCNSRPPTAAACGENSSWEAAGFLLGQDPSQREDADEAPGIAC